MSLARRGQGIASTRAIGLLDRIGDPPQLDPVVLDDGEAGAGIAVAGQADAARIEHHHAVDLQFELHVGMAHADDVGVDVLQPLGPGARVLEQVLVERVAGGGVDQQEPLARQREPLGHRQLQRYRRSSGPSAPTSTAETPASGSGTPSRR